MSGGNTFETHNTYCIIKFFFLVFQGCQANPLSNQNTISMEKAEQWPNSQNTAEPVTLTLATTIQWKNTQQPRSPKWGRIRFPA